MSPSPISRSPDLKRLRDEGYDIAIVDGHLVVRDVPYVTADVQVDHGMLVSELSMSGDVTARPRTHVAYFAGGLPHNRDGQPLSRVVNSSGRRTLAPGLQVDHMFSRKPPGGYSDYHAKVTAYVELLANPAQAIDPEVTARTFPVVEDEPEDSPFHYTDTATSRAGTGAMNAKLAGHTVAIVGQGGTGTYILDQLAKTPVDQIHTFDGDTFLQHNAFRSPGAASVDDLRGSPNKAAHFAEQYSRMHRNVVAHPYNIDGSNVDELLGMDFVFLAIDPNDAKAVIVERLTAAGVPFIDTGVGVYQVDGKLAGTLRVTTVTEAASGPRNRIPVSDGSADDPYAHNIQIADLNSLNAALAVIRWKRRLGFYNDLENEHHSTYDIDGNHITNEDRT